MSSRPIAGNSGLTRSACPKDDGMYLGLIQIYRSRMDRSPWPICFLSDLTLQACNFLPSE
jgi:hypothetical protein